MCKSHQFQSNHPNSSDVREGDELIFSSVLGKTVIIFTSCVCSLHFNTQSVVVNSNRTHTTATTGALQCTMFWAWWIRWMCWMRAGRHLCIGMEHTPVRLNTNTCAITFCVEFSHRMCVLVVCARHSCVCVCVLCVAVLLLLPLLMLSSTCAAMSLHLLHAPFFSRVNGTMYSL